MAILRHFHDEAVRRVYHRAAIIFLVLTLVVLALTSLLGPTAPATGQAVPRWQSLAATTFFLLIAFFVVRRGYQVLTFLLSLLCLMQGVGHLLAAAGMRLAPGVETDLPGNRLDWPSWQEFLQTELATETPFYHRQLVASTTPVDLLAPLRSWPLLGNIVPQGGPLVAPATVLALCAVLLGLATLALWRAARLRPR